MTDQTTNGGALAPLPQHDNRAILTEAAWYRRNTQGEIVATPEHKYSAYRIGHYVEWLDSIGGAWWSPDLAAYADYLLNERPATLAPRSAQAHLSTIRGRYQSILKRNQTRDMLYSMTPDDSPPERRKAFVDEAIERLRNAADPLTTKGKVKVVKSQDVADSQHVRLTKQQADALLDAPGTDTLLGLRDTAIIALMLCTGVREAELVALDVPDLRQELGGELALHVRMGKGAKERLIPYGALDWALAIVDSWLEHAGVAEGPVFRGFYKGARRVRPGRIHVRAINQVMARYPIAIDGKPRVVNPHDCRRTYAKRLYEAGVNIMAIKDNLGHSSIKTTEKYIGVQNADERRPPSIYSFDLARLRRTLV